MKEDQGLLFDGEEGRRLGLIGMGRAAEPTSVQIWLAAATDVHDNYPVGKEYSADDIVRAIGLVREVSMNDNNYVGSWFRDMKADGRIREIGRIRSKRTTNHGKKITLYRKVW